MRSRFNTPQQKHYPAYPVLKYDLKYYLFAIISNVKSHSNTTDPSDRVGRLRSWVLCWKICHVIATAGILNIVKPPKNCALRCLFPPCQNH